MKIEKDRAYDAGQIQIRNQTLWLVSMALISDEKLLIRLAIQENKTAKDEDNLTEEYLKSAELHPNELAYNAITTLLDDRLMTFAQQKTESGFEGNGLGSYLFRHAEQAVKFFITELLSEYPQVINYWVDDLSEPVGWTTKIAEKNGFVYQGRQPEPTFLKKIPVK